MAKPIFNLLIINWLNVNKGGLAEVHLDRLFNFKLQ